MRIALEEALAWAAISQHLVSPTSPPASSATPEIREGLEALDPNNGDMAETNDVPVLIDAIGGVASGLNHLPYVALAARSTSFRPDMLESDQTSLAPQLFQTGGLSPARILAPIHRASALCRLANTTFRPEAEAFLDLMNADEVRNIVAWIHKSLNSGGKTYLQLRELAPPEMLRQVERGAERSLHQETALQQIMEALTGFGELVTTLDGGLNTSEGPYRYHERRNLCSDASTQNDEAFREIAGWYVRSYAPIGIRDLMAWTGLPDTMCRRALGGSSVPLRTVDVTHMGEGLLVPEDFLSRSAEIEPVCVILPWLDHWLQGYQDLNRFAPNGLPDIPANRDLVLVSIGPGIHASETLAGHIRVVGSARSPRFQPQPWRPLADHETQALDASLQRISAFFAAEE